MSKRTAKKWVRQRVKRVKNEQIAGKNTVKKADKERVKKRVKERVRNE